MVKLIDCIVGARKAACKFEVGVYRNRLKVRRIHLVQALHQRVAEAGVEALRVKALLLAAAGEDDLLQDLWRALLQQRRTGEFAVIQRFA